MESLYWYAVVSIVATWLEKEQHNVKRYKIFMQKAMLLFVVHKTSRKAIEDP
jgi:hypothetical protein